VKAELLKESLLSNPAPRSFMPSIMGVGWIWVEKRLATATLARLACAATGISREASSSASKTGAGPNPRRKGKVPAGDLDGLWAKK